MKPGWIKQLIIFCLLGVAVFGIYYNTLDNEFVFDDYFMVLDYGAVRLPPQEWPKLFGLEGGIGQYRPLRTLSYAIDYQLSTALVSLRSKQLGGFYPFVYHLFNVVYHWLAACLAFLVALRLMDGFTFTPTLTLPHQGGGSYLPELTQPSPPPWRGRIKEGGKVAFLTALLWAIHPIQTDSVAYVSGRRDILAGLFFFLGFYTFMRFRASDSSPPRPERDLSACNAQAERVGVRPFDSAQDRVLKYVLGRGIWLGVTFLAFALGVLSKEVVIVLPLVFFAYDLCRGYASSQGLWRQVGRCLWQGKFFYLPLFGAALFALGYYLTYVAPILKWHGGGPLATFATVPRIWMHYLKLLLFPLTLNADYSGAFPLSFSLLEGRAFVATLGVIVLVAAVLWGLRQEGYRLPAFCGLWFMITLLPVSQVFPHPELVAEHYLYLPSFGFCLLAALVLAHLTDSSPWPSPQRGEGMYSGERTTPLPSRERVRVRVLTGYGLLAVFLSFYGMRTVVRNQDWQDEETFWQKTVETAPASARAHHNLGVVLKERGDLRGALREFQKAVAADPNYGYSCTGIAEIYLQWMRPKEALAFARKGVELRPKSPWAHFVLGLVHFRLGEPRKAIAAFERALALRPDLVPAYQALADLYRTVGEEEKAQEWQRRFILESGVPSSLLPGGKREEPALSLPKGLP